MARSWRGQDRHPDAGQGRTLPVLGISGLLDFLILPCLIHWHLKSQATPGT